MKAGRPMRRWINSYMAYALGAFALIVPGQAFQAFYNFYYVDKLGLSIALFTLGRTIFTIWDAVNDPLVGILSDRTRTRFGRRKPWLIGMLLPFFICFLMVFAVPLGVRGSQLSLFWWFLVATILYEAFSSIGWVNYNALLPELYQTPRSRSGASAFSQALLICGVGIAAIAGPILYGKAGFAAMAAVFGGIFLVTMVLFVFSFKENALNTAPPPMKVGQSIWATLKNREFWTFYIPNALATAVETTLSAQVAFYAKYSLNLAEEQVALMMAAIFISIIPFVPVWSTAIRRFGALKSWRMAFLVFAVAVIPLYFAGNLVQGMLAGVVAGFGLAGWRVVPPVLAAEIIDRDALRCGQRREGIYGAAGGFLQRISNLILTAGFWLVSLIYGYRSGAQPGNNPGGAFRFMMSVLPLLLLLAAFALSFAFREVPLAPNHSGEE